MYTNVYTDSKRGEEILQRFEALDDAKADLLSFENHYAKSLPGVSYSHTEVMGVIGGVKHFDIRKEERHAA